MQEADWEAAYRREGKGQLVEGGDRLTGLYPGKAPHTLPFGHRPALQAFHIL